jgi:two-component system sensor histidine kinase RegB
MAVMTPMMATTAERDSMAVQAGMMKEVDAIVREAEARVGASTDGLATARVEREARHRNMLHLIQLRWIAVIGQITTIAVVTGLLGIDLPVPAMTAVLVCLVAFNLGSHLRWHERQEVSNAELFVALLVDVFSFTAQLYLSGGTTNPFIFLYLLQVVLSAVLLKPWSTWTIVAITTLGVAVLALVAEPLNLPPERTGALLPNLYVLGLLICFVLNASLLVVLISRISGNLHTRDVELEALRQRAVEEEHIVRMGLLASGAAHELGTPLATLSVILSDWKRMPQFASDRDLADEMAEMQSQLQRCKSIVSGILLAAGKARGESSTRTTLNTFIDAMVEEWRSSRTVQHFEFHNAIDTDVPIAFDSTIKQMVFNILDNAIEASPAWLRFEVLQHEERLLLRVTDAGPGFTPAMLANYGKPYHSTKGRPGSGLGLFLVVNVARVLGGAASVRNRAEGGAVVEVSLPLDAIRLPDERAGTGAGSGRTAHAR